MQMNKNRRGVFGTVRTIIMAQEKKGAVVSSTAPWGPHLAAICLEMQLHLFLDTHFTDRKGKKKNTERKM